jgi:hypothetical protein
MSHDTKKIGLSRTKIAMPDIKIAPSGNRLLYQAQTLLSQVLKWHRWAPQLFCHHKTAPLGTKVALPYTKFATLGTKTELSRT